ncbi:MAG: (Fe-S)-binding protein [Acidobacteriota bacterium]|jgi:Fe-S oxidoreductase|nr:(Fe-S)-binding protein [Acidobacteriota bacterium]
MLTMIEKILFVLLAVAAVFLALKEFRRKALMIRRGRPVERSDRPLYRFWYALKRVILQLCAYENRPVVGFFHSMIFWGFLVYLLVTLNHVVEGFFTGFNLLGHGGVRTVVLFGANVFAGMILLAAVFFLVRRYVFRPSTLDIPSVESAVILGFISTLMVSFVLYEAFKLYGAEGAVSGNFLAVWVKSHWLPAEMAVATQAFWLRLLWWLHILVVMAFGVLIPYSKHLHLVAGPVNLFFKNHGVRAEIPVVDLEAQEFFGTPKVVDLTQKDLLDLFACAECGRCDDVCPALRTGKTLSPKTLLHKMQLHLLENGQTPRDDLKTLLGEVVSEEEIWACTTCGACMEVCPMFNEHIPKITGMRQYGVMMESRFPEELQTLYRGLENQGNPWGINAQERSKWTEGLDVPLIADKGETDVLLWVGCEGAYDNHAQRHTRMLVEVLQKAGVDFAILGDEEKCCGDPARRSGHEYLFQMLAMENIDTLNRYKFRRIVTMCPHGLHVLRHEYARMGGEYQVLHYSQLLTELVESGALRLREGGETNRVTYHDPCYLGRYQGEYEAPRRLLEAAVGKGHLVEMADNRARSFCCGAGGGGMWKEEEGEGRMSHARLQDARACGAGTLVTACPYCSVMFKDAIEETESKDIQTRDLIDFIHQSMA